MHVWTLDGEKNYLTIHALIDKKLSADDIMKLKKDMKAELEKQ
jgi:Co/Zn/Cd efflux system component